MARHNINQHLLKQFLARERVSGHAAKQGQTKSAIRRLLENLGGVTNYEDRRQIEAARERAGLTKSQFTRWRRNLRESANPFVKSGRIEVRPIEMDHVYGRKRSNEIAPPCINCHRKKHAGSKSRSYPKLRSQALFEAWQNSLNE